MLAYTHQADTPWEDTSLGRHPLRASTPMDITPKGRHLPNGTHPLGRHPPGRHPLADTPPSRHPLGINTPSRDDTAAGGTHPTGMRSCVMYENDKSEESKCVECLSKQKAPCPYPIVTPQGLRLLSSPIIKICLKIF